MLAIMGEAFANAASNSASRSGTTSRIAASRIVFSTPVMRFGIQKSTLVRDGMTNEILADTKLLKTHGSEKR